MYSSSWQQSTIFVPVLKSAFNRLEFFFFVLLLLLFFSSKAALKSFHDLEELVETHAIVSKLHILHQLVCLIWISTQTLEDRLEIFDAYETCLFEIEHDEDHSEVLDFLLRVHLKNFLFIIYSSKSGTNSEINLACCNLITFTSDEME